MSKPITIEEVNKSNNNSKDDNSSSPTNSGFLSRLLRFDLSRKKSVVTESPPSAEPPATYYGVYIPCEIKKGPDEEIIHVYQEKLEALELVKKYKQARFKVFRNRQEAVEFALRGAEYTSDHVDSPLVGERPYPFKAPSPQEMVQLRKAIEADLLDTVRDRVWDNPRYLISSGNTPAILQEGSRYNALHVAAKAMNAEMCNIILTTVGNPAFVEKLYGADTDPEVCKEFASILVDRYLNTPDKGMNETPLHFAAKFGSEHCVDMLTSFPQCNMNVVNKFQEQAKDMICKRARTQDSEVVKRIERMLHERFYVPVLHSEDNSSVPTIGQPFNPSTPPDLTGDPLSPRYEIRAFAGPMEASDAAQFRRRWKTPPRSKMQGVLSPAGFRLKEITKGLETVGRNLAEEMKVGWKEYWPFLDTFTDLRTTEGLNLLENYLKDKYENAYSYAYNESIHSMMEGSQNESNISKLNISNIKHENTLLSPMSDLCLAMKGCTLNSFHRTHTKPNVIITNQILPKNTNGDIQIQNTVSQILCIERTCQVFAKRIADALIFSLTAEGEIASESLKAETKHLLHTIASYMDDTRFQTIDFHLIHSRLSQMINYKLKELTSELDDIELLIEFLNKILTPKDDCFSSDDERNSRSFREVKLKKTHVLDAHVRCVAAFLVEDLTEGTQCKGPSASEKECETLWGKASKCCCEWRMDRFDRNTKRSSSFKRSFNRSALSQESVVKKLDFEHHIGDGRQRRKSYGEDISQNSPAGDSCLTSTKENNIFGTPPKNLFFSSSPPKFEQNQGTSPPRITIFGGSPQKTRNFGSSPKNIEQFGSSPKYIEQLPRMGLLGGSPPKSGQISPRNGQMEVLEEECGESVPILCTLNVDKCQVLPTSQPITEDNSEKSSSEDEMFDYETASEHSDEEEREEEMLDASDRAAVDAFIYGEEPTKMDRLVFDAISQCNITPDQYPNVFRWRHTVGLYPPDERNKWQPAPTSEEDTFNSSCSYSFNLGQTLANAAMGKRNNFIQNSPTITQVDRCSTPKKNIDSMLNDNGSKSVSLQVSNWLRVTGPNSPRRALVSKNIGHNASFGF